MAGLVSDDHATSGHVHGYAATKDAHLKRLRRIEGQVRGIQRMVEFIQTDFGQVRVVLTPWLPDRSLMGVATSRVRVVPLRGRSFQRESLARTGDNWKGQIVGEYTLEVHHADKMFQARGI